MSFIYFTICVTRRWLKTETVKKKKKFYHYKHLIIFWALNFNSSIELYCILNECKITIINVK